MRGLRAAERFSHIGGWRLSRVGRHAVVSLASLVGVGVFLVGAVAVSGGRVLGPAGGLSRLGPSVLWGRGRSRPHLAAMRCGVSAGSPTI
jgi:hypothetical protein